MHTLYMNWVKAFKMKVYQVPFPPLFKQLKYWSGVRRSLNSSDFVIPQLWSRWSLWIKFVLTWRDSVGLTKITIWKGGKKSFSIDSHACFLLSPMPYHHLTYTSATSPSFPPCPPFACVVPTFVYWFPFCDMFISEKNIWHVALFLCETSWTCAHNLS